MAKKSHLLTTAILLPPSIYPSKNLSASSSQSREWSSKHLVWLNQKACKLPLFFSFCGRSVIILAGVWEPHGGFPRLTDTEIHTTRPNTHDHHTQTRSLTPTHIYCHTHTYTHLHPHPPSHPPSRRLQPGPNDRVQALDGQGGRRLLVFRPAPDCSQIAPGQGRGLSASCEVLSRKAPWELPV